MERKRESQNLTIWWEKVMELGEEAGHKGSFLGWDNWRGGTTNMGQKNSVNQTDPYKHYVD